MTLLNDVMDAFNDYATWVFAGRENEDLGDNLKEELVECLRGFFFHYDGDVDEANVDFANANSDLNVRFGTHSITIEIPESVDGDEYIPLTVTAG